MEIIDRNKLRGSIRANGMTQADLAKMLEISPNSIYNKLSGKTEFTESEIAKLRTHFGKEIFIYK
jgi:DNA-binding XRE family transcriptional regulator